MVDIEMRDKLALRISHYFKGKKVSPHDLAEMYLIFGHSLVFIIKDLAAEEKILLHEKRDRVVEKLKQNCETSGIISEFVDERAER